jgi:hypothetical protein
MAALARPTLGWSLLGMLPHCPSPEHFCRCLNRQGRPICLRPIGLRLLRPMLLPNHSLEGQIPLPLVWNHPNRLHRETSSVNQRCRAQNHPPPKRKASRQKVSLSGIVCKTFLINTSQKIYHRRPPRCHNQQRRRLPCQINMPLSRKKPAGQTPRQGQNHRRVTNRRRLPVLPSKRSARHPIRSLSSLLAIQRLEEAARSMLLKLDSDKGA